MQKKTVFYSFVICVLYGTLGAVILDSHVLFEQGENGVHTFRIPVVIKAQNGDILAFAEARQDDWADTGNIDIVMKRSTDGGSSWSPMSTVVDNGSYTIHNCCVVLEENSGDLVMVFSRGHQKQLFLIRSTDNGNSWSSPVYITEDVTLSPWTYSAHGPCHGIQLKKSSFAGRLVMPGYHMTSSGGDWGAHIIYSDDNGYNWQLGGTINASSLIQPNESTIAELSDGTISIMCRNENDSYTERGRITAYSTDGGQSFSFPVLDHELMTPICQASLLGTSYEGSEFLIFSSPKPADWVSRKNMKLSFSMDDTQSWPYELPIYEHASAYSDMVKINEDQYAVFYEQGNKGDWFPYYRMVFTKFSVGGLFQKTVALWEFSDKEAGESFLDSEISTDTGGVGIPLEAVNQISCTQGYSQYYDNKAVDFNRGNFFRAAENDYLDFDKDDSFTIETVFRTSSHKVGDNPGALIQKGARWWVRIEAGTLRFLVADISNNWNMIIGTTNVSDNKWHHAAFVKDSASGEMRIYLDYKLERVGNNPVKNTLRDGSELLVGAFSGTNLRDYEGEIDFVKVSLGAKRVENFVYPSGDLNNDSCINMSDLSIISNYWNNSGCSLDSWCGGSDINRDTIVNISDLSFLYSNWLN
jgi:sialidase-1